MPGTMDEVCVLVARHCHAAQHDTPVPGLTLFRADARGPQVNTMYRPTLCVVAQGRKQVVLGERLFEYDASHYMVVTVDLPVTGCIVEADERRPYLALSIDLDPLCVADLLLAQPPPAAAVDRPDTAMATSPLGHDLLDPVARLLRLLDRPGDAAVLAPLIRRELHYRLLQGEQGGLLRQAAVAGSHLAQIGRTADWIRAHFAEPLEVKVLARQAGMSVTSFHRHFKSVTMMSPLQYRTRIRLQEARRLMLMNIGDAGRIGFGVGYESPSQFSRDYRRMFGMPPAADAARLRRLDSTATCCTDLESGHSSPNLI